MKTLNPTLILLLMAVILSSCNTPKPENQAGENVISEDIRIYYFHNTKRCATCHAVEDETKTALTLFYENEMQAGTIEFTSLNLQEEDGEKMAQALQVSGQTLLIVKDTDKINLTNEGFMNARTNPAKFHEILKSEIDKLL